jgi:hypothetical protein
MLNRTAFCQLARLDPEGLKSLARRDQLPFNARSPERKRDSYSIFETFLTVLADELSFGGERAVTVAMRKVSALAPTLTENWPAIAGTGSRLAHGEKELEEILCAEAFRPSDVSGEAFHLLVCGTTAKVLSSLAAHRPLVHATVGNASRAAKTLVERALHFEIELPEDLAAEPPLYHQFGQA